MYRRVFVPAHETILWARKDKDANHYFNYYAMKGEYFPQDSFKKQDQQVETVWSIMPRTDAERKQGTHPTQKPVALLRRIVLASTKPGDIILDPFNGGGTTGIAVAQLGKRQYIGCDLNREYINITIKRHEALMANKELAKKPGIAFNSNEQLLLNPNKFEQRKQSLEEIRNKGKQQEQFINR